jgi:hypothetical protein
MSQGLGLPDRIQVVGEYEVATLEELSGVRVTGLLVAFLTHASDVCVAAPRKPTACRRRRPG